MDINALHVFVTVAKEGSMTRAARRLKYVQSNISTIIQQLESELQTTLFYRHRRGVSLTSTGKMLLSYTEKVFRLLDEAKKAIQSSTVPCGSFTIGSMETMAAVRLPDILATYHRLYPKVDLELVTGPTEILVEKVLQYELDGAFVAGPVEHPAIIQEPIVEEDLVLVANPAFFPIDSLQNIKNRTILVFRSGCLYRAKFEQFLYEEGILPVKKMELGTLESIIGCVTTGLGISLLPYSFIQSHNNCKSLCTYTIPEKYSKISTVFIRRKDAFTTVAMSKFFDLIKKALT